MLPRSLALYLSDDETSPKRYKVRCEWRKLHNEEFCDLHSSSKIVLVIKSRKIRLAGHIARTGGEVYTGFRWRNVREGDHWEDPGVDGRILRWHGEGMDCNDLAQDRDRWRTFVDAVMYLAWGGNGLHFSGSG